MDFSRLRAEIPAARDRVYLNTGTSGPTPQPAARAQIELLETLVREGFSSPPAARAYDAALEAARGAIARVLRVDPRTVALTQSTSDGLGIVASGLAWNPGDEVIISDLEHISGIAPWMHLAATRRVVVKNLRSSGGRLDPDRVEAAITSRTRLVCISHVSFATGALLPVEEVCRRAHDRGVLVLVDGAQAAGQLPLDVGALGCDFYALPGQKWLLGPEGTGGLYVCESAIDRLQPTRIGWASLADEDVTAEGVSLHASARRYEAGTVHAPAFAGLSRSIQMLEEIGWERVRERARELALHARRRIEAIEGVAVISPLDAATGLLTFRVEGADPDRIVKRMWSEHRVVVRSIAHLGAVRASFHAFNTEEDANELARALESACKA